MPSKKRSAGRGGSTTAASATSACSMTRGLFLVVVLLGTLLCLWNLRRFPTAAPLPPDWESLLISNNATTNQKPQQQEQQQAEQQDQPSPLLLPFAQSVEGAAEFLGNIAMNLAAVAGGDTDGNAISAAEESAEGYGAVEPFDLSINHLSVIDYWDGALPDEESAMATTEDFLPIVAAQTSTAIHDLPLSQQRRHGHHHLRFRLRARPGSAPPANGGISAYQIVAQHAHSAHHLWDSGRIDVNYLPPSIEWTGPRLEAGSLVQWRVQVWDAFGNGPTMSPWSKFGVGPASTADWVADWIVHPSDLETFFGINLENQRVPRQRVLVKRDATQVSLQVCQLWQLRLPLPLARVEFVVPQQDQLVSALLVASGLGMFSITLNGQRLSSSSVQDPPLTDFAQRVSYRGFDVTTALLSQKQGRHAVGITLGAGWWDHRPIGGAIVFMDFMAKGAVTTICQLHLTYRNGTTSVVIPTGTADSPWQMGKGPLMESNLYTGEAVDLAKKRALQGWDTAGGGGQTSVEWVQPVAQREYLQRLTVNTTALWRQRLETWAIRKKPGTAVDAVAPIGELVPLEMPPVLPIRPLPAVSVVPLDTVDGKHSGRWLLDFGKAMSGTVRFPQGLPPPMVPEQYPRAHNLSRSVWHNTKSGQATPRYVSVVYGDSLELSTGDVNLALVAGFGHHAGGERNESKPYDVDKRGGACFPQEDLVRYQALTQRDTYVVVPSSSDGSSNTVEEEEAALFRETVRQPHFSVHGFRYAEVCCTAQPPVGAVAVQYRTAYPTWGQFDSSNPVLNGAYELTRNALESNTVGLQSDCPHRERLQYGGDIVGSSPAALHMFDLSAFYAKVIRDWTVSQFSNGAYTVTSTYMDLLPMFSITGRGSGDPVWATVAPILTARHLRHYGDVDLVKETLQYHVKWAHFLYRHWDEAVREFYPRVVAGKYEGGGKGLGDWLALIGGDGWLANTAFYLAAARSVAYLSHHLLNGTTTAPAAAPHDSVARNAYYGLLLQAVETAQGIERNITKVYSSRQFTYDGKQFIRKMGQDLALFTKMVPGKQRCAALASWALGTNSDDFLTWAGKEEIQFHKRLRRDDYEAMAVPTDKKVGDVGLIGRNANMTLYRMRRGVTSGVLGIRYLLKTLSNLGHHTTALTKASSLHFPGYGGMLSWNATTLWETWYRSEDIFSRNHPMFGAVAEWLAEAVAGVALSPTTTAGRTVLFWPRIPTTVEAAQIVHQASATQGTRCGTAAIAWKLLPADANLAEFGIPAAAGSLIKEGQGDNANQPQQRQVVIRMLVPPGAMADFRLPRAAAAAGQQLEWSIQQAATFPNLVQAQREADKACQERRQAKQGGFPFVWHYDRAANEFYRLHQNQSIGTPCESFLFHHHHEATSPSTISWQAFGSTRTRASASSSSDREVRLPAGLFQATLEHPFVWSLEQDLPPYGTFSPDAPMNRNVSAISSCSDTDTFDWDIRDAEHLI